MRFEEDIARELAELLPGRLPADASVSCEGTGVHWHCEAEHYNRRCRIACFAIEGVAEYLTNFHDAHERVLSYCRTRDMELVLAATADWLGLTKMSIGELRRRHPQVEKLEETLHALANSMRHYSPELGAGAQFEVKQIIGDLYEVWIRGETRMCRIKHYGAGGMGATFHWDASERAVELFRMTIENPVEVARVAKSWIVENCPPSEMRQRHPDLEIGELADSYEQGRGMEGEFVMSWDELENFYLTTKMLTNPAGALAFLRGARVRGYDRLLRAGSSMWTCILSRSRRHGLRPGQPRLAVTFGEHGIEVEGIISTKILHRQQGFEFTPEVEGMLAQLAKETVT